MIYPCARCSEPYELAGKRRASHYCPDCRVLNAREKKAEADRERNARREDQLAVLNAYTSQGMGDDYAAMMLERLDEIEAEWNPDDWQVVGSDYFEGERTPAGPDEGRSSFFADLRDELDGLSDAAVFDPWWQHHPNWWKGMHEDGPIPEAAFASFDQPDEAGNLNAA